MHSIFTMDIPRQFADLNAHVFLKVNQNLDQDASAIAAGFRQVQDQILRAFADLANIRPAEHIDPLPFLCDQNPALVQVLFQVDDLLQRRLSADGDNNHQYLSIVRVVFQSRSAPPWKQLRASSSDSHPATSTESASFCATATAATTAAAAVAAACSLCATAAAATAATAATAAAAAAAATAASTVCAAVTTGATTAAATHSKWPLCC